MICLEMLATAGRMGAVASARLEASLNPLESIVIYAAASVSS